MTTTPNTGAAELPEAQRFTKKPVTIEAIKWTGKNLRQVITFTDGPPDTRSWHVGMDWEAYADLVARDGLKIYTLEGKMLANVGDWIIRGVKGEYYPCKPDIFDATYSPAAQVEALTASQAILVELIAPQGGRMAENTNTEREAPSDGELVAIYKRANGEDTGKAQALTTKRIVNAMRAAFQAGRASIAQPAVAAGWISVDERLPGEQGQDSEEVMLFINGHCALTDFECRQGGAWGIRLGYFDVDIQAFRVHGRPQSHVTHWMKLHTAPSTGGESNG